MKIYKKWLILCLAIFAVILICNSSYVYYQKDNSRSKVDVIKEYNLQKTSSTTDSILVGGKAELVSGNTLYNLSFGNTEDDQCLTLTKHLKSEEIIISSLRICSMISGGKKYSFGGSDVSDITFSHLLAQKEDFSFQVDIDFIRSLISYSCKLKDFKNGDVECSEIGRKDF